MNFNKYLKAILSITIYTLLGCDNANYSQSAGQAQNEIEQIIVGAERLELYLDSLKGKNIAVVANHASFINKTHLVDSLLSLGVNIKKVFSPEHGFRGDADAGESVKSEVDLITKLPIISLYGSNKKPTQAQLADIDVLLFDLQDVGVRFYTYISTLHYIVEAASDLEIPLIILDRPNPNSNYIDGPILKNDFSSFVGIHPIPVVYGLTIGELGGMINGEKWTNSEKECKLTVIRCSNYDHKKEYILPIAPSPNLPNQESIYLYPSLCFFEGTTISVGRGTSYPFQQIGSPDLKGIYDFSFTPKPSYGAKEPKNNGEECFGVKFYDNNIERPDSLSLNYLISFYKNYEKKEGFFNSFFNLLAGEDKLKEEIIKGSNQIEIKRTWKKDLLNYKEMRKNYLLY